MKSFCFKGSSSKIDPDHIRSSLGLLRQQQRNNNNNNNNSESNSNSNNSRRFIVPLSECEFHVASILEELSRDPWPQVHEQRAVRYEQIVLKSIYDKVAITFIC